MKKKTASFWGKHFCFGDFIDLSTGDQIVTTIIYWLNRFNFQLFSENEARRVGLDLKFWMAPPRSNYFLCALITGSQDKNGRFSPVFISLQDELQGLGKDWGGYYLRCLNTWNGMQDVIKKNFEDLPTLQRQLTRIPIPERPDPGACIGQDVSGIARESVVGYLKVHKAGLIRDRVVDVEFQMGKDDPRFQDWLQALADRIETRPQSMFVLSRDQKLQARIFYRAFTEADLHSLCWRAMSAGEKDPS